jgi:hypothetical protein
MEIGHSIETIVSDEDVETAFTGTNFGPSRDYRHIIADTLLKIAGDFSTGHTAFNCCQYLGLLGRSTRPMRLTKKGRRYLFWAYHDALNQPPRRSR